jgi:RecB family exonuclease
VAPAPPPRSDRPEAAPRLSFSALQSYARCPYRFYLERTLRLPREKPPPPPPVAGEPGEAEPGLDKMLRGSLVHRLLEELDLKRPEPPAPEAVAALGDDNGAELTPAEIEDIQGQVAAFAGSPLRARLATATRVRREAPFTFALDAAGSGPLVIGFVDVLATEPDGTALIVDYKTHELEDEDPEAIVARDYDTQRVVYALAALRDRAPRVEVAHLFLERPAEPVTHTYTAADAPALAEHVTGLARGMLDGHHPVAANPHRELCGDCPGRRALCSWPEEATLREPAEAGDQSRAGSFSGSGGPS